MFTVGMPAAKNCSRVRNVFYTMTSLGTSVFPRSPKQTAMFFFRWYIVLACCQGNAPLLQQEGNGHLVAVARYSKRDAHYFYSSVLQVEKSTSSESMDKDLSFLFESAV